MSQKYTISIVDDDQSVRESLEGLIQSHGYVAHAFESGASFLTARAHLPTDCLIVDMHMPDMTGLDLCGQLGGSGVPIIMITALDDGHLRGRALAAGVLYYLTKPFDEDDLLRCIRSALGQ